jgi:hypothetical protein
MEINKTSNKHIVKKVVNNEGEEVLDRDPKIQLYLEASNLKIKEDSFYETSDEKLEAFLKTLNSEKDNEYLEGLAKFLCDNGIKLSPVIISVILSNRGISFRDKNFERIFNTPQRISEAIALSKRYHLNNSFKQNTLKVALEGFKDYTLLKNKLENRQVKTKDIIKLLRPKPANITMAKLYKDIIESNKGSKLKKTDSLVSMKSSNETTEVKMDYVKENITKIPINQLIRNLKFIIENTNYNDEKEVMDKVIARLNSVTDYRYLNVFDLIEASIAVPKLEKALHEVTKNFTTKIKEKNNFEFDSASVLFDLSGSMDGDGLKNGFKYLVLMSMLYNKLNIRFFEYNLMIEDDVSKTIIENIRKGQISTAFKKLRTHGSTGLVQSTLELLNKDKEINTLIVISDEVSWVEGSDIDYQMKQVEKELKNRKLILINPVIYKGTVFKKNIVAMASLTSSIIIDMGLFTQQKRFIEFIKKYK